MIFLRYVFLVLSLLSLIVYILTCLIEETGKDKDNNLDFALIFLALFYIFGQIK